MRSLILLALCSSCLAVFVEPHVEPVEPEVNPDDFYPTPETSSDPESTGTYGGEWSSLSDGDPITEPAVSYAPNPEPNACLDEEGCSEVDDKAEELMKEIVDKLNDALGGGSSSAGATMLSTTFTSAQATANTTLQTQTTPAPIPYWDVATAVGLDNTQLALFDVAEQSMFINDPLCFFANIERKYASAASASSTTAAAQDKRVRQAAWESLASCDQTVGSSGTACAGTATALNSQTMSAAQSDFFANYITAQLVSIYAPDLTSASGQSASLVTSTATCAGLDGTESFTTPYIRALAASATAPANTYTLPPSTGGGDALAQDFRIAAVAAAIALAALV